MGSEGHGRLAVFIGGSKIGRAPGSAVITLHQNQIDAAAAEVLRGSGVAQLP